MNENDQHQWMKDFDREKFLRGLAALPNSGESARYLDPDYRWPTPPEPRPKPDPEQIAAIKRRDYLIDHSIEGFLEEESLFRFDPEGRISSTELYELYKAWCREQKLLPETSRCLCVYLKKHREEYCIAPTCNILTEDKRHVRGFRGIRCLTDREQMEHTSDI